MAFPEMALSPLRLPAVTGLMEPRDSCPGPTAVMPAVAVTVVPAVPVAPVEVAVRQSVWASPGLTAVVVMAVILRHHFLQVLILVSFFLSC